MDALRDILVSVTRRARTAPTGRWLAAAYRDQPLLFGLATTWLAFCAVPLAVFLGYAAFWAVVALLVSVAIFLFWAGLGLLFLVPALCIATGLSVVVFVWAATTYAVVTKVLSLLSATSYDGPLSGTTTTNATTNATTKAGPLGPEKPPSYALVGKTNGNTAGTDLDKTRIVEMADDAPVTS